MAQMTALQGGEAHFFEESLHPAKVKEYLARPKEADKLKGMKWLLAMLSKGKDVSEFFADVVKNVVVRSVEVKKMVYNYLVHYADADATCRELALLSVNSFQKDLAASNQLIRALALRVMTSIRVPDIIQIQLLAVRKCASDSSPYVRKCAANAVPKIYALDPDQKLQLISMLEKLLKDGSTMVLGSAVASYAEVCPTHWEVLHPAFRKLCHLLADVDEWGQMIILRVLTSYARAQFTDPCPKLTASKAAMASGVLKAAQQQQQQQQQQSGAVDGEGEGGRNGPPPPRGKTKKRVVRRAFYSDEEDESTEEEVPSSAPSERRGAPPDANGSHFGSRFSTMADDEDIGANVDPDHRLLLRSSMPLLKSRNAGVVLAVCTLHFHCGTSGAAGGAAQTTLAKAMVRILRNNREIQFVVLHAIHRIAQEEKETFRPFLKEFFVKASDPAFVANLKLEVMTCLVSRENAGQVLLELQGYMRHSDKGFVGNAVKAVGRVAVAEGLPEVTEQCLSGLLTLVCASQSDVVVSGAVVVIRQLLQQLPGLQTTPNDVVRRLVGLLVQFLKGEGAGEEEDGLEKAGEAPAGGRRRPLLTQPSAVSTLVWIAGEFYAPIADIAADVLRLLATAFQSQEYEVKVQILTYAVKLALRCPEQDTVQNLAAYVMELARFDLEPDIRDRGRFLTALLGLTTSEDGVDENLLVALRSMAQGILLPGKPMPVADMGAYLQQLQEDGGSLPTFSVGSLSALVGFRVSGYLELPKWATKGTSSSIRDPPHEAPPAGHGGAHGGAQARGGVSEDDEDFLESSSSSGGSSSSSSGSSDESSGSSDSGSSSDDASSERSESESESESERSSSSRSRSSSSSSSSSSSDGGSEQGSEAEDGEEGQSLLDMSALAPALDYGAAPPPSVPLARHVIPRVGSSSSSSSGRSGNVGQPHGAHGAKVQEMPTLSLSRPATLLKHEMGRGLEVTFAFQRGAYARVGTELGLRLTLRNARDVAIRRIKMVPPRDGTPVQGFGEVSSLAAGESKVVEMRVDFGGRSNKEVRFEIKSDKGSNMVTITCTAEELVWPVIMSATEFAAEWQALSGSLNEATSQVALPAALPKLRPSLAARVVMAMNVSPVVQGQGDGEAAEDDALQFSGRTLTGTQGNDKVLVRLVPATGGKASLSVACDNAVQAPLLLAAVKKTIQEQEETLLP